MTAKEFRMQEKAVYSHNGLYYSKNGQLISKDLKKDFDSMTSLCSIKLQNLFFMDSKIEIRKMPEMKVVYVRHQGEFHQIVKAYDKLMKWAAPRGLLNFPETKSLTVYHDNPALTAIEKIRQDACITVVGNVKEEGEVGKFTVPGGNYAVGRFEIDNKEFEKAWNTVYKWFTESAYQPGHGITYELNLNDPMQHPERKHIVDICIPIKSLLT